MLCFLNPFCTSLSLLQAAKRWKVKVCKTKILCSFVIVIANHVWPLIFLRFFLDQKWSSGAQKWCRKVDKSFDRQLLCVSFQPFVLSQLSAAIVLLGFPQCVKISFFVRKFNMLKTRIKKVNLILYCQNWLFLFQFSRFLKWSKNLTKICVLTQRASYRKTFCWYFGLIHFV